jgi:rubrerythrin
MHVLVKRFVLGRGRPEPYVECRDCGTTLSSTPVSCPACGSADTVSYEIA